MRSTSIYPPADKEARIVAVESGVDAQLAQRLVILANDVRNVTSIDLEEGVSTRSLGNAAKLVRRGVSVKRAYSIAIAQSITDEREEITAIELMIDRVFGAT